MPVLLYNTRKKPEDVEVDPRGSNTDLARSKAIVVPTSDHNESLLVYHCFRRPNRKVVY